MDIVGAIPIFGRINSTNFDNNLQQLISNNCKHIIVAIDSLGGDIYEGLRIANIMFKAHYDNSIEFYGVGLNQVGSAATIPFLAISKKARWVTKNCKFLIHDNSIFMAKMGFKVHRRNFYLVPEDLYRQALELYLHNHYKMREFYRMRLQINREIIETWLNGEDIWLQRDELIKHNFIKKVNPIPQDIHTTGKVIVAKLFEEYR